MVVLDLAPGILTVGQAISSAGDKQDLAVVLGSGLTAPSARVA
jgi:hypothetical protein